MTFSLSEFNLKKQICWVFHVDDRSKASSTYDMIIGRDLLGELGIILNFNHKTVTWDTDTIPMKDRGTLNSQNALTEVYLSANEPQSLVKELSRSTKILDAEYKPGQPTIIVCNCNYQYDKSYSQYMVYWNWISTPIFQVNHIEILF